MQHLQYMDLMRSYIALRAAGRAYGRALARRNPDVREFELEFGGPMQPRLRELRRRLRSGPDPLAAKMEKRLSWWAERTYTLVLSSLADCAGVRNVDVAIGDASGVQGLTIRLRPTWAASVHSHGVAVVDGCLTLSVRKYPHTLPSGARAYYATWVERARTGLVLVRGALYRASPNDEWQHAEAEIGALDRVLEIEDPHITVPERPPRVRPVRKSVVRAALDAEELALVRRAARTADLTLSEWATVVMLAASTPSEEPERRSAILSSFARRRVLRSDANRYLQSLRVRLHPSQRGIARSVHRCPKCGELRLDGLLADLLGVSQLDCIEPGGNCERCKAA